jgi:hypothetical protein
MFREKIRCPHCHHELSKEPRRTIECPYCEQPIYYRYDDLCTEEDAIRYYDWRDRGLVIFNLVKR